MTEPLDLEAILKSLDGQEGGSLRFVWPTAYEVVPALVARIRELEAELGEKNNALATLVRLDEREACAQIAESESQRLFGLHGPQNAHVVQAIAVSMEKLASAIRARGTK